jgi:hypothetical protein
VLASASLIAASFTALAISPPSAGEHARWPDSVDLLALAVYLGVAFGLPAAGYCLMALDVRRYLRSLRRALAVVARAATPSTPSWARHDQPPCLLALELRLPCTEDQVLAAYRRRVKDLHPDRGGDLQQFLRLQNHFEQAMHLARQRAERA